MVLSDKDLSYREIITNAVCGKGTKYSQSTFTIRPSNTPTTIGGCWVMNHSYEAELAGDVVEVHGSFDINVWYSYNGNSETAVAKDRVSYREQIPLKEVDPHCFKEGLEVAVKVIQMPNCLDASVVDHTNEILVRVEKELSVEVIGRTKICVVTCSLVDKKDEEFFEEEVIEEDEDFED
jgi:spore coat protein E